MAVWETIRWWWHPKINGANELIRARKVAFEASRMPILPRRQACEELILADHSVPPPLIRCGDDVLVKNSHAALRLAVKGCGGFDLFFKPHRSFLWQVLALADKAKDLGLLSLAFDLLDKAVRIVIASGHHWPDALDACRSTFGRLESAVGDQTFEVGLAILSQVIRTANRERRRACVYRIVSPDKILRQVVAALASGSPERSTDNLERVLRMTDRILPDGTVYPMRGYALVACVAAARSFLPSSVRSWFLGRVAIRATSLPDEEQCVQILCACVEAWASCDAADAAPHLARMAQQYRHGDRSQRVASRCALMAHAIGETALARRLVECGAQDATSGELFCQALADYANAAAALGLQDAVVSLVLEFVRRTPLVSFSASDGRDRVELLDPAVGIGGGELLDGLAAELDRKDILPALAGNGGAILQCLQIAKWVGGFRGMHLARKALLYLAKNYPDAECEQMALGITCDLAVSLGPDHGVPLLASLTGEYVEQHPYASGRNTELQLRMLGACASAAARFGQPALANVYAERGLLLCRGGSCGPCTFRACDVLLPHVTPEIARQWVMETCTSYSFDHKHLLALAECAAGMGGTRGCELVGTIAAALIRSAVHSIHYDVVLRRCTESLGQIRMEDETTTLLALLQVALDRGHLSAIVEAAGALSDRQRQQSIEHILSCGRLLGCSELSHLGAAAKMAGLGAGPRTGELLTRVSEAGIRLPEHAQRIAVVEAVVAAAGSVGGTACAIALADLMTHLTTLDPRPCERARLLAQIAKSSARADANRAASLLQTVVNASAGLSASDLLHDVLPACCESMAELGGAGELAALGVIVKKARDLGAAPPCPTGLAGTLCAASLAAHSLGEHEWATGLLSEAVNVVSSIRLRCGVTFRVLEKCGDLTKTLCVDPSEVGL